MRRRNGKSSKQDEKAHASRRPLENSLSDYVLTQSRVKQRGVATWQDIGAKENSGLCSRQLRSPVKRLTIQPIAIDRDKRFRRKRGAQLDAALLPIKKKGGTTCIPTSGSRESRDSGLIDGAATLPSGPEIAEQMPASGYLAASAGTDWAELDSKDEELLEFLHACESFDDQTSEDASQSCTAKLTESKRVDGQPLASTANRDGLVEVACFPRSGEASAAERNIDGEPEAGRCDREVSTSANAAPGAVEESPMAIESADYPPSSRLAVHHPLETPGIPQREVENAGGSSDDRAASPVFSLPHPLPDPDHERTLADQPSMSVARSSPRGARARDAKASGGKARSRGVYLDEDYHFLMSLHRQLNGMPLVRKMKVKVKIQTLFYEELRARTREPRAAA